MTVQQLGRYRWSNRPTTAPVTPWQFPRKNVMGEIKPYNPAGVAAGVRQLARWRDSRPHATLQLIAYRQEPRQPSRYQLLAADTRQLAEAVNNARARKPFRIATWYDVGTISVPRALEKIELWQCPTLFGNVVEEHVRARYAARVGIGPLPKKDASRPGPDIEHELLEMAEFLRELAAELEAEAGSY